MQADKKAVQDPAQIMQYKSDYPPLIEKSLRELSRHFNGIFSNIQTSGINKKEMLASFDQMVESLLGVLRQEGTQADLVMMLYLSMQFFKITQISNSKNKAGELLAVISQCYRFMGFSTTRADFKEPGQIARCVIEGEYRQVVDWLSSLSGKANPKLHNRVISLLREKMNIVSELTNLSHHNTISSNEFYYQREQANELIAESADESNQEIRENYAKILNILAGNFESILEDCESPIQLIKAYLLYIDPEMSEPSCFETLCSSEFYSKSQNIQFLFIMMTNSNDPNLCLEFCVKVFPIFVYHSLYLYSCYLVHPTKGMREHDVIADILRDFSLYSVDFFTAKPYIARLTAIDFLGQNSISDISQICLATVDPARNSSKSQQKRSVIDLILNFLRQDDRLQDIVSNVVDSVIDNEKAGDAGIEDVLPLVICDARIDCLTAMVCPSDECCLKMMSPGFKITDQAPDRKLIDALKKVVLEMASKSQMTPFLAFVTAYVEMRDHIDELIATNDPREVYRKSILGRLLADLSKEFANDSSLYKMIYIPMLAYRSLFKGSLSEVNELLHNNLNMKTQLDFFNSRPELGSKEARSNKVLLECVKRSNILLNAFRVNCNY